MASSGRRILAAAVLLLCAGAAGSAGAAESAPAGDTAQVRVGGWYPYWSWPDQSRPKGRGTLASVSAFDVAIVQANDGLAIEQHGTPAGWAAAKAKYGGARADRWLSFTDQTGQGVLAHAMSDPEGRRALADLVATTAAEYDVSGVDLDLEGFAFQDPASTWATTAPAWTEFVKELDRRLAEDGLSLAVTTPPIYNSARDGSSGYWVYAWDAIAPHIDRLRIMAYDYSYTEAGPTAPLEWTEGILEYATATVDPAKIELGIPAYGRNFVLRIDGNCPSGAVTTRTTLTMATGPQIASLRGAKPRYDARAGEMTFSYSVIYEEGAQRCTIAREAWYPSSRSIKERLLLARDYKVRGVHIWALPYLDDAAWKTLTRMKARGIITSAP